jgi:hypothetical protein
MTSIESLLVKGIGKKDITALAKSAGSDEVMFIDLLDIITKSDKTSGMKAAWIIGTVADNGDLDLINKHAERIYQLTAEKSVGGIVRELMKALTAANLCEDLKGHYLDFCFRQLTRMDIDVAIKYNANKFIIQSLKAYPELKAEFISILESLLDAHNDAWKKYTSRIIARLRK